MQPYQRQSIQLQRLTMLLGDTQNFQAQLDSLISEFVVGVQATVSVIAATPNAEGVNAIVQQIQVNGALNGGSISPINSIRGPQLAEMAQFIRTNVSYSYGSLGSTGAIGVFIPCTFEKFRMEYPLRTMSCLPSDNMGSLNVRVTLSTQAQLDTNAAPTMAFSNITVFVQQNQFFKGTIPSDWAFFYTSMDQIVQNNLVANTQFQTLLPNGAAYELILIRSMTATNPTTRAAVTKQVDGSGNGPINALTTSNGILLLDANNVPKRAVYYNTIRKDNLDNITDALVNGNACFQFNRGLWDIWRPQLGNNTIPLNIDVNLTGTTSPAFEVVHQRLFDPKNSLALA